MRRLLLVSAVVPLLWAAAPAGEQVELKFVPPVGKKIVEKAVATKVTEMGAMKRVEMRESTTEFLYTKVEKGFEVGVTVTAVKITRDGAVANDPIVDVMTGLTLVFEVDPTGKATRVRGMDVLHKKLVEKMPPEVAARFAVAVPAEQLEKQKINEFNSRVVHLVGKKLKVGGTIPFEEEYTAPMGTSVKLKGTTTLVQKTPCGKESCVLLRTTSEADPESTKKVIDEMTKVAGKDGRPMPQAIKDVPIVKATIDRVVHPATLNLHSEKQERTVTMKVPGPTGVVEMKLVEKQDFTFSW